MVWKSPRRQHGRGNTSEASSISSQPLLSSPAEIQVREIASRIGLFEDSEILATVCQKMRKEYIVEEWQLPALDSRQWEKMHAPIGLAAAVKHVSTHRLREQEMQFPFRDRSFNDNRQGYGEKGESLRVLAGGDNLLSSSFEEDTALITTSSSWSSKEEEDKAEIEIVDKSKSDDHPVVRSKEVFVKMEDEPNEIKILTSTNEKEQDDDLKIKKTFSADCADWLKLVVATEKDEEDEVARKEQQRGSRASSVFRRVKNDSGDDNNGAIEPMMKRKSSSKMVEVAQGNIEPANGIVSKTHRSVEDKRAETYVETEPFDTLERGKSTSSAQDVIEPSKNVERGIPAGNEKNLEPAQFQIESFRGMEQGGLMPPAKAKREQEVSQTGANFTESTESDCVAVPKDNEQNEMSLVGSGNRDRIESATTSIHVQTNVENDLGNSQTEGLPEMNSSDSESDENTNIFSGIANTASFSEDEDDNRIPDKDAALLDRLLDPLEHTEDSVLSSMSDPETNLLLFSDYGADDITVAVSNVSPECKKAASQRKKKMNKYRYEYDRDTSSFETETAALQSILVELPDDDHRAILSQLMIMTNARDKNSRTNLAFQVQDTLVGLIEKNEMDVEPAKAVQLIFHLSRLKKSYRQIFGKSLFKAMSKLYKRSEKLKEQNGNAKKIEKNTIVDHKDTVKEERGTQPKGTMEDDKSRVDNVPLQI